MQVKLMDNRPALAFTTPCKHVLRRMKAGYWVLLWLFALAAIPYLHAADNEGPVPDRTPSTKDLKNIQTAVASLRGKKFLQDVPVFNISEKALRDIVDREVEKEYPGKKLADYTDLLAALDMVPAGTDLKEVYANFMVDQVAGLYDSDTKEMCIPRAPGAKERNTKKPAEKKVEDLSQMDDSIVFAHEFTHALEDQYWPIDRPEDKDNEASTDEGTARSFLYEGSATRLMIEALPALQAGTSAGSYRVGWNVIHSSLVEAALKYALLGVWQSKDALTPGVPEALARIEAMPYSYGYAFCTRTMRRWGLDGLDYIYDHPPVSTEQMMHPQKAWEWRDYPVEIQLPETLRTDWKRVSEETLGEAGIAVHLGCKLKNLNKGLKLAEGWDGDRAALYEGTNNVRMLVWAAAWDSPSAARRFGKACVSQRALSHKAAVTSKGNTWNWTRDDGTSGILKCEGKHVVLIETKDSTLVHDQALCAQAATFTEPAQDAERENLQKPLLRRNPLFSSRRDGTFVTSKSLCGLLSRHERNSIGGSDQALLGIVGETRRTSSFHKWQVGWALVARHESEVRRAVTKTTFLPWGILASHFATALPQAPDKCISHTSLVWGLAGSSTLDATKRRTTRVLPFGLLIRHSSGPGFTATHLLLTGYSHRAAADKVGSRTRIRLLGIPVWTHEGVGEHS